MRLVSGMKLVIDPPTLILSFSSLARSLLQLSGEFVRKISSFFFSHRFGVSFFAAPLGQTDRQTVWREKERKPERIGDIFPSCHSPKISTYFPFPKFLVYFFSLALGAKLGSQRAYAETRKR